MRQIKFFSTKGLYGCFSNFSRHPVVIDGMLWLTTEHYFQAMKYHPHDPEAVSRVRGADTPLEAKRVAWKSKHIRKDWDTERDVVMLRAIRAKVSQHETVKRVLLATGDAEIVENSSYDSYWGIGKCAGLNRLGQIWMQVRDECVKEEQRE